MVLVIEVGLGPGDILLDGDQPTLIKKAAEPPPILGPFLLWPNGWMHQYATCYRDRPQPSPGELALDGDPVPYPKSSPAVFTARRIARITSAVLAMSIPSVCLSVCPSVTRRYCVKTTARTCSTVQFALSDNKMCLVL